MKKTIPIIILLIILIFTFTGCTATLNGLDKHYFIISFGIDKVADNRLKLSIQISSNTSQNNSGTSESSQSSNYKIYTVEANTLEECFNILNSYLDKKINLTHCSAFIISEELAREGIKPYFSALTNNTELRDTCNLIISSGSAYDVLNNVSNSGETFSSRLYDYLTNSTEYTAFTTKSTIGTFSKSLENSSKKPVVVYVKTHGKTVQTDGLALFDNYTMIGTVSSLETIAHQMLKNDLKTCILTLENPIEPSQKMDLDISLYKNTNIDIKIINETPYITINIYPEGIVTNLGSTLDLTDTQIIKSIENSTNNYIKEFVKSYLYTITKKYNSDSLEFEGLYKSHFKTEEEFEKVHWKEFFQDTFYNININTKINSSNLFNKE